MVCECHLQCRFEPQVATGLIVKEETTLRNDAMSELLAARSEVDEASRVGDGT